MIEGHRTWKKKKKRAGVGFEEEKERKKYSDSQRKVSETNNEMCLAYRKCVYCLDIRLRIIEFG